MSGFISNKYLESQEFQEGQVPDDISDQPAPQHSGQAQTLPNQKKDKKPQHEEDQFIFQTVPDNQFKDQFHLRPKQNYRTQDYYQQNQTSHNKDWERKEKQISHEKKKNTDKKKQLQNLESKRKPQHEETRPPILNQASNQMPTNMTYYPNMPPMSHIYGATQVPPFYPPGYPVLIQNQVGQRPPFGVYPPAMHQPHPPSLYQSPQNPYQMMNLHHYQLSSQIPFGNIQMAQPIQMGQPIHQIYRGHRIPILQGHQINDPNHPSTYDPNQNGKSHFIQNNPPNNNKNQAKILQKRQKQEFTNLHKPSQYKDKPSQVRQKTYEHPEKQTEHMDRSSQDRYEQRQRSRDRKDFSIGNKNEQKQKQYERQPKLESKYDSKYDYKHTSQYQSRQKFRDKFYQSSSQNEKLMTAKEQKQSQMHQKKTKIKTQISESLNVIFGNNPEEKEQFLFVLRDVMKYKLLNKQQLDLSKSPQFQSPAFASKPLAIYSLTKQLILSNYEKALLRLEKMIAAQSANDNSTNPSVTPANRKQALFQILTSFQLEQLLVKIKLMKLRRKLIGEKKMSEIKKLLEQLVKDPRKRVK